jgi:hypothetical protein
MIHIITPCTRPENLSAMQQSIPPECTWTIVLDASVTEMPEGGELKATVYRSPSTGHFGNSNRNFALDHMYFDDLDWIYILDDDNIVHPDWYARVSTLNDADLNMVSWGQVWQNNNVRLQPTQNPKVGNTDTSCYMVRGRIMQKLRYELEYVADGILAERVAQQGGHLCLYENLGYYNYLRTPDDQKL